MTEQDSRSTSIDRLKQRGRWQSHLFALFVAGYLGATFISYERRGETVPTHTLVICLTFIGVALGVSIPSELIGAIGLPSSRDAGRSDGG